MAARRLMTRACDLRAGDTVFAIGYPAELTYVGLLPCGLMCVRWGHELGEAALIPSDRLVTLFLPDVAALARATAWPRPSIART